MRWYQRFFRRKLTEKHLDAELRFHLEQQIADYIAVGMNPDEARRRARLEFGGLDQVKEECRDVGGARFIEILIQDLRYGVRQLLKSRGFAISATLSLALGIGATTLVFSVIYDAVLNPYPYRAAQRIVQMAFIGKHGIRGFMAVNSHDFATVRQASTVADAMLCDYADPITTVSGYAEDLEVVHFSGNAFEFLGVAPLFGRTLTEKDRNEPLIVLGYAFCRAHFQCDPSVLGRKLDLDHREYTVVGVMPPRFAWGGASAYAPLVPGDGADDIYPLYLRARKRVRAEVLSAQMLALVRQFVLASDGVALPPEVHLRPMEIGQRGDGTFQKRLGLLFAAVCTLLLIACANVSILLLGRATTRQQEFEIRNALGATRPRLACQLLTEVLLIAYGGGLLGVALTYCGIVMLRAPLVKSFFPPGAVLGVNTAVLVFSTALSLAAGILFGLFPSLQLSRNASVQRLNVRFTSGSKPHRRSHRMLIAAQVASTLVLLVATGAAIHAFVDLYKLDLGYDPANVLTFRLPVPAGEYASWGARMEYREVLQERLQHIPGVAEASVAQAMPTGGGSQMEYALPGEQYGPDMDVKMPLADMEFVDPHFLPAMRIPVIAGRAFTESEYQRGVAVALINRTFARRVFGSQNALGRMLRVPPLVAGFPGAARPQHPEEMVQIIGITGDVRNGWLPGAPIRESIYMPESLFVAGGSLRVSLRTVNDPRKMVETVRRVITELNPDQPISQARTLSEILSEDLHSRDRWLAILFGCFSSLALFFAVIGLYSVTSFAVAQRTREFGVRVTLGATRADIFRSVLLSEFGVVLTGLAVGTALSLALGKLLRNYLSMPAEDVWLLPLSCLVMLLVSALASYLPARRAARIEPLQALRTE